LLSEVVQDQIARMLRIDDVSQIGRQRRLMELGLDSLMAVELRGMLNDRIPLEEPLPSTLVFDYPTVDAIVGLLVQRLRGVSDAVGDDGVPRRRSPSSEEEVRRLSEVEAEAALLSRLNELEGS